MLKLESNIHTLSNKNAKRPIEAHIVSTWEYLTNFIEIDKTLEYMKKFEALEGNWNNSRDSKELKILLLYQKHIT